MWPQTGRIPSISSVSYNTRGTLLVTGGDIARIWDAKTGHLLRELPANGPVPAVAFSPDGTKIAIGGFFVQEGGSAEFPMGQVVVFDTTTYKAHKTLIVQGGAVASICFSPDGNKIAAARQRGSVTEWDANSGQTLWKRDLGWSAPTSGITYSPDGKVLAVASWDGTLKLVDTADGHWDYQLKDPKWRPVNSPRVRAGVFTPDGKTAISVGDSGKIVYWNVGSGQQEKVIDAGYPLLNVAMTFDGNTMATIGTPAKAGQPALTLWNVRAGTKIKDLPGMAVGKAVAFSPDDKMLAYGGTQNVDADMGGLHVLEVASGSDTLTMAGQQDGPFLNHIEFSPDEKAVLVTADGAEAGTYVWDVPGAKFSAALQPAPGSADRYQSAAWGDKAVGVTFPTAAVTWPAPPTGAGTRVSYDETTASSLVREADGTFGVLDVNLKTSGVEVRDAQGAVQKTVTLTGGPHVTFAALTASGDGKLGAVAQNKKEDPQSVSLFDTATGQVTKVLDYASGDIADDNPVNVLTLSQDGALLGVGSVGQPDQVFRRHGYVDVWDTKTGKSLFSSDARAGNITAVAFSPDGKEIASCGHAEGRIRLWLPNGKLNREIQTHEDAVALAYSPSGKYLAATCADGSWRLYAVKDHALRASFMLLPPAQAGGAPEWLVWSPPGYFESSPGANQYLYWLRGQEVVGSEEYANMFHRPDLLVQSIHP
jgi:WD40 repeat protein